MRTFLLPVLLSVLLCSGSMAQKHEYSFMEKYPEPSSKHFSLSTADGFIQVLPDKGDNITVYYIVKKANNLMKISREELEGEVNFDISTSGGSLDIKIRNKEVFSRGDWKNRYDVSCEVYVPVGTYCDLRSSDGDIEIEGLEGDQKCKTSDGHIRVSDVSGDVEATTSDGDVNVKYISGNVNARTSDGYIRAEQIDGDATFETSDGDVNFENVTGHIEATTSDGFITFSDCSGSLFAETSDGDIKGNFLKLTGKLSMITSDGDIHVTLPSNTGMDVKMKGEDLSLPKVELSGVIDEHHIEGKVFGGGPLVELITSDGHVTLSLN